MEAIEESFAS